ncbi:MAG TPA: SDR family NAD(P)-dependent oxidoreductase, partial [Acidisphaera sp.]|nr:SDR family NAD(P)-dependent oxidoreductase [Acidisphaera sp.]
MSMHEQAAARLPTPACYPVLAGQVALVTGASSGIGRAVAVGLASAGADVVVNFVTGPESAQGVVDEIQQGGRRAVAVRADVSREDEVQAMFRTAVETFGTVHILVNNAGLQRDSPIAEMSLKD